MYNGESVFFAGFATEKSTGNTFFNVFKS